MPKKRVDNFLYEQESYSIRGACFEVWKAFAGVHKEKIVERALKKELEDRKLQVETQKRITVAYKNVTVGIYTPDFVVNERIIIELKSKPFITASDKKQFWNYLRGTPYKLGFLINFGEEKLDIIRRVYDTVRSKYSREQRKTLINKSVNLRSHRSLSAAFTLIELLLVIAIVAILAASAGPSLTRLLITNNLEVGSDKVISAIRKAQSYAMDGKGNTTWGVCMSGANLRLFSGSCASPTYSEDYDLTGVSVSGLSETTFSGTSGQRGEPSSVLNITISNDLGSTTVGLNAAGGLDIN